MAKLSNIQSGKLRIDNTEYDSSMKMNQEVYYRENLREFFQIGDYFHVVFNFKDADIEFCSDGIARILGYDPVYFSRNQLLNNIHPEDLPIFLKHEIKTTEFYSGLSPLQTSKYKVRYDFRVQNQFGVYKRLMRQVVHFGMDDAGKPTRTLSVYTDISYLKRDTAIQLTILGLEGEPSFCDVNPEISQPKSSNPFSERELQVLKLLSTGTSVKKIAIKLNLCLSTINNHRHNMLLKAGVKTCPGLLGKAIRNGWIG